MRNTDRPLIGVTLPDRGGYAAWLFLRFAINRAGGAPRRITPSRRTLPEPIDGLILAGGADVGPQRYGATRIAKTPSPRPRSWKRRLLDIVVYPLVYLLRILNRNVTASYLDEARDALEFELLQHAVDEGLPVLGICRGQQLINVFFGGSLHQELTGFYVEEPEVQSILPRKMVTIYPGTHLAELLGPLALRVNGLHRQGVDRLGTGIRVSARDRNSIIQAIEHTSLPFLIGVQWHPEYLPQAAAQRKLFAELVARAERLRDRRVRSLRSPATEGALP